MDDSQPFIEQDSSTSNLYNLHTWKIAICQIVFLVIYGLTVLILSVDGIVVVKKCDILFITFFCQAALWIICLIVDHYYKWQHHLLYLKGHFEFQKTLSKFSSLVFAGLSFFNAVFLIFAGSLLFKFKNITDICATAEVFIPTISVNIIIGIEIIVLTCLLITYAVKVLKFNEEQPVADIRRVSFWIPENSSSVLEVGYRGKGEDLVDLLQKQADLIQYYKGKIGFLNEKIMKLSHHAIDC